MNLWPVEHFFTQFLIGFAVCTATPVKRCHFGYEISLMVGRLKKQDSFAKINGKLMLYFVDNIIKNWTMTLLLNFNFILERFSFLLHKKITLKVRFRDIVSTKYNNFHSVTKWFLKKKIAF